MDTPDALAGAGIQVSWARSLADLADAAEHDLLVIFAHGAGHGLDYRLSLPEGELTSLALAAPQLEREYGVTIPAGSCYSVGAGGHVTAGGYGLLSRLHGLTVDYLHAVEVVYVDANGRAGSVQVSEDSSGSAERQLLWACQGGGGGNFGIVTRFWFKELPPSPECAGLATLAWNWSDLDQDSFAQLVLTFGEYFASHGGVGDDSAGMFALLHLNQNTGSAPQIVLTVQDVGDGARTAHGFLGHMREGLPRASAPVKAAGHPHAIAPGTSVELLPWLFATQTLNGSGPNRRGKYKSAYMIENFPMSHVEAMWDALQPGALPQSQSLLQIDSYGCRVNAVAPSETAIAQRSSTMKLQFQTYWTAAAQDDENLAWIRDFYTAMYGPGGPVPDGTVDGCYVGYPDVDLVDWQQLYYKDNYPALQQAKAEWDPLNVFNHKQSIGLPGY